MCWTLSSSQPKTVSISARHSPSPASPPKSRNADTRSSLPGYIDDTVPLTVLAGLLELRPVSECESILGYIESRISRLTLVSLLLFVIFPCTV